MRLFSVFFPENFNFWNPKLFELLPVPLEFKKLGYNRTVNKVLGSTPTKKSAKEMVPSAASLNCVWQEQMKSTQNDPSIFLFVTFRFISHLVFLIWGGGGGNWRRTGVYFLELIELTDNFMENFIINYYGLINQSFNVLIHRQKMIVFLGILGVKSW